jgi:hypothetical protein
MRYWYYRVAHREILEERRANAAAATEQRNAALAEIRARYDATRVARPKPEPKRTPDGRRSLEDEDLWEIPFHGEQPYGRHWWETSPEERAEVDRVRGTKFEQPESEQLQEFTTLEGRLDWNWEVTGWWVTYTFAPPIIVLILGASLFWALRGFRHSP